MPRFSVILPTHDRPDHLRACLSSLLGQYTTTSYEIIVVSRVEDARGRGVVRELSTKAAAPVREVHPHAPGFLCALRVGLAAADGEFVAFTDDDAVYPSSWLERLTGILERPGVGGAGGTIAELGQGRIRSTVRRHGRITVSGRQLGSPYDVLPPAVVEVDVLPGANMAYRRDALTGDAFPLILQLDGGAPGNEAFLGALVRQRGLRLLCDTGLVVEHFRAPRADGHREAERADRYRLARSRSLIMRQVLTPVGFCLFLLRVMLVGEGELPGLGRLALRRHMTRAGIRDLVEVLRGISAGCAAARKMRLRAGDDRLAAEIGDGCSLSA